MKALLREITASADTLLKSVMMSSVMPSLNYSCSASPLILAKGSTQMAVRAARWRSGRCGAAARRCGRRRADVDQRFDGAQQVLDLLAAGIDPGIVEIDGMKRAHIDGQCRALESDGHEDAAISRVARLAAHPARFHGGWGPDHEDGGCDFELGGDQAVELLARNDLRVPPDRPALRLDRGDQRRDSRLVAAGIGNEDVGHDGWTCTWKVAADLPRRL